MNNATTSVQTPVSGHIAPGRARPLRVLHVLDHSWPVLDGYSQRSRSLLRAQRQMGFAPTVLTSPLHQQDDPAAVDLQCDSVDYFRTPVPAGGSERAIRNRWPLVREMQVIRLLRRRINALLAEGTFDVVHAHSPSLCGLAALRAAHERKIPFVYEIRSFWEDSDLKTVRSLKDSVRYKTSRGLETYVLRRADAVVGISQAILGDISARGISPERLFHAPNGVDLDRFTPGPPDLALAERLGTRGVPTLGYLGTFFPWEGVSWLVRAAAELRRTGVEFKLLLIGDGAERQGVERTISDLRVSDCVQCLGRVPHEQVGAYYSVLDVLVYPRLRTRITELVTPLKPLEAMALGKAVLGSDVGGVRELVDADQTGLLFRAESIEEFVVQATRLLKDSVLRNFLGDRARKMVTTERDWKKIVQTYELAYYAAAFHARERLNP